jgi:predicted dehydrogenase
MASTVHNSALRFLVIGCGSIGKRHIRNLISLGEGSILAVDVRDDRRAEVESEFGVEVLDSLQEAWKRDPTVVLITAPTSMHVPLSLEAAERGCHLFIEKPLSHTLTGVDELLGTVTRQGLVTLVGCNMRFHPTLATVKKLVEQGAIGKVVSARVQVGQYLPDWHPWEDYRLTYSARRDLGGGIILDAIHEIDYIRWLLGEVEAVACFSGKLSQLEIETEDNASILLRFSCGAIGQVHMDYIQRSYTRKCDIIGDDGTICWDYSAGEGRWYSAATREWQTFTNPSGWDSNHMYLDEMRYFLRCLTGEEKTANSVNEALHALRIALAAKTSNKNGQIIKI